MKAEKNDVKIPFHSFRERQFFCHFIINIVLNLQWANELQYDTAQIYIFFVKVIKSSNINIFLLSKKLYIFKMQQIFLTLILYLLYPIFINNIAVS